MIFDNEKVDILDPVTLQKTGVTKLRTRAKEDGDWLETFNVWIIQAKPTPAIVFQLRSPQSTWEPNKLDVSAGGHLSAGEEPADGVREAEEELGRKYNKEHLISLGNRKNPGNKTLCNIFLIEDNAPLTEYTLDVAEVPAVFICPMKNLLEVFADDSKSFTAQGISHDGKALTYEVMKNSFPYNADDYIHRMIRLVEVYLQGDKNVHY